MSSGTNIAVGLVRNKLLAVLLGPSGVGLFAQLLGVQSLVAGLLPMGMQAGLIRYVAKYRASDPKAVAGVVSTASRMFMLLSLPSIALCFILLRPLASWALDSTERIYLLYLVPPILGIPFLVQSELWLAYLRAGLAVKLYSKSMVTTAVLGLAVVIPLVLIWGKAGAAVHLLLFAILGYVVSRAYAGRTITADLRAAIKKSPFDISVVRNLARFGVANIPVTVLVLLVPFIVRAQIVDDLGFFANGIYQAAFAISNQYILVATGALDSYCLPKISQMDKAGDINNEVNNGARGVLLFATGGILVILLARDLIVRVLLSAKFLPAIDLLPVQMLGDLLRSVAWALWLPFLPQERFAARAIISALHGAVFLGLFFSLLPYMKLHAAVWAHAVAWTAVLAANYIYLNKVNGFRFPRQNIRLMCTSLFAVAVVGFTPFPEIKWRLIAGGVAVLWAATAISRSEWLAIRKRMAALRS